VTANHLSDAEAHGTPDRLVFLVLLSALVRGAKDPLEISQEAERVLRTRPPSDVDARIRFLASRPGLPEIHPARLAEVWGSALSKGCTASRRDLLDLARRAVVTWDEPDAEIGPWRRALFARLEPILSARGALDTFTPETPPEIRESHLELDPLLANWPRRLLHAKEWA
jgi:hypothetical protein